MSRLINRLLSFQHPYLQSSVLLELKHHYDWTLRLVMNNCYHSIFHSSLFQPLASMTHLRKIQFLLLLTESTVVFLWTTYLHKDNEICVHSKLYCMLILHILSLSYKIHCNTYPSMTNLLNSAALSQTGHVHVGFFSFMSKNIGPSKHCKWLHVEARLGTVILILPNCENNCVSLIHNWITAVVS